MIVNGDMIAEFSQKLNIHKEIGEPDEIWHNRVIYSVIGGHLLASLFDIDDDSRFMELGSENTVSMQHVTKRSEALKKAFSYTDVDSDYFREIYIKTGFMLHKNNRLTFPKRTISSDGEICYIRGMAPWNNVSFSGLGLYTKKYLPSEITLEQMFLIETQNIHNWFVSFQKSLKWEFADKIPSDYEFLNITGNVGQGYWQTKLPNCELVLARKKQIGITEYIMLQNTDLVYKCSLKSWQVDNEEYRRIAIALRILNGVAPRVSVVIKSFTVELTIDYLLPTAEQNFFELFGWPIYSNSRWKRVIAIELYPTFKRIFINLGFKICEV